MSQPQNNGILSDLFDAVEDFNKLFFHTVKALLTRPESVIESIARGPGNQAFQNREFVSPFRFAVICFSFTVFFTALLGRNDDTWTSVTANKEVPAYIESALSVFNNFSVFLVLIAFIPASWLLSRLFSNSQKSSSDCYKISLYLYGLVTLMEQAVIAPVYLAPGEMSATQNLILSLVSGLLFCIYVGWAFMRYFKSKLGETIWKTLAHYLSLDLSLIVVVAVFMIGLTTYFNIQYPEKAQSTPVISEQVEHSSVASKNKSAK